MKKKRLLIIAGEVSGDLHAAHLVKALKSIEPHIEIFGVGGKRMKDSGVEIVHDIVELAVVGFIEVLKHLGTFKKIFKKLLVLLETKKLHLKGQGDLNLETNDVTAHITAKLATHDPTIQAIQQLLLHGFPLVVTGKLDNLAIHPDKPLIRSFFSHGLLPQHFSKPIKLIKHHLKQLQYNSHDTNETTAE